MDCCSEHQLGGDAAVPGGTKTTFREPTVTFDVRDFDEVAEVMEPKKRRRLSEQQRLAAIERLRPFRLKAGETLGTGHVRAQNYPKF